ncbi:MAG: glycerophosphodiester phosphodiesterase family protein [Smithella sp.]|jgi:glycerophosphoryl diester phosphodiesterase
MKRKRFLYQIISLIILSLLGTACGGGGSDSPQNQSAQQNGSPLAYEWLMDPDSTGPLVAAHRGAHKDAPENSLAAIRAASLLGADFVEVDVRHTLDGVLVLMHDSNASRTTGLDAEINTLTYAQVQQLTLLNSDSSDPETTQVPTLNEALTLASEVSVMLYVDIRTDRDDLVVAAIQAGDYYKVALLRDSLDHVIKMYEQDSSLLLMPPAGNIDDLNAAVAAVPGLKIVEYSDEAPNAEFCAAAREAGVKVQQDVFVRGDILAVLTGSYSGWASFIEAGVWLLQTDEPEMLVPAVLEYRETGVFP